MRMDPHRLSSLGRADSAVTNLVLEIDGRRRAAAGPFHNASDRWYDRHPNWPPFGALSENCDGFVLNRPDLTTNHADPIEVTKWRKWQYARTVGAHEKRGYGRPADIEALAASASLRWTIVRDPLSHFVAGFEEVENFFAGFGERSSGLRKTDSAWYRLVHAGGGARGTSQHPSTELRMRAMLADLLLQRGSIVYLKMLWHLLPQTLGFGRSRAGGEGGEGGGGVGGVGGGGGGGGGGSASLSASFGMMHLDYIGKMENLSFAMASVQSALDIDHHKQWKIPSVKKGTPTSGTRREHKNISLSLEVSGEEFRRALCLVLEREYACLGWLGYVAPRACAAYWGGRARHEPRASPSDPLE
jgi:hypothetical protein